MCVHKVYSSFNFSFTLLLLLVVSPWAYNGERKPQSNATQVNSFASPLYRCTSAPLHYNTTPQIAQFNDKVKHYNEKKAVAAKCIADDKRQLQDHH